MSTTSLSQQDKSSGSGLKHLGYVDLPAHLNKGGFDHAAVHTKSGTVYVAHTANNSLDLIDSRHDKYLHSILRLAGVAGALVSNEKDLVFTSNRGEKTIGIFQHGHEKKLDRVIVGGYPNGLSFDPSRGRLLVANVSRQDDQAPITVSVVDVASKEMIADITVPGRTRWTVFDKESDRFYVNVSRPAQIVAIDSKDPDGIAASYEIPATGPHGLDLDNAEWRLFCACDDGGLFTIDLESAKVSRVASLSGTPDVIFYNERRHHLYVAVGDPGVIDVFDTNTRKIVETVRTERGAHTIGYNPETSKIYAFLPETHRAAIYSDE